MRMPSSAAPEMEVGAVDLQCRHTRVVMGRPAVSIHYVERSLGGPRRTDYPFDGPFVQRRGSPDAE